MKNYMKVGALAITVFSAVAWSSCTDGKSGTAPIVKKNDPVPVKVLELQTTQANEKVLSSGKITTDNETFLAFKVGGVVDQVLVQEGDAVKKGQTLATLDQTEINGMVSQSKLMYEKALRDFRRVEKLFKDSVVTLEQLQNAQTALDVSAAQLKTAEFNKQHARIVAPQNGFVLRKFVNPGQIIGIGDPVLVTNGISGNNWILKVNATDKQWSSIQTRDKATVRLDAFPQEEFEAVVFRKSESADPFTGTFTIELKLTTGKNKLASGLFGTAEIQTNNQSSYWSIPYEALLDANGNKGFVFVTSDYKTAVKQPVTITSIENNTVSISSGIENYKALIVSGSAYLTDKSEITILK